MATTVRTYDPSGLGYRDVTTNLDGEVIRETRYSEDGVVQQHREHDPETGRWETTRYEGGKRRSTVTTGRDGEELERREYDDQERLWREEVIEDFTSTIHEFSYDREGRLLQVDRVGAGGIEESTEFTYDENGRLRIASRTRHDGLADEWVELDEDGELSGSVRDARALLEWISKLLGTEYGDGRTHTTPSVDGGTVRVRHNPDGSFDYSEIDSQGRLVTRGYTLSGRCYLGDSCPLRDR